MRAMGLSSNDINRLGRSEDIDLLQLKFFFLKITHCLSAVRCVVLRQPIHRVFLQHVNSIGFHIGHNSKLTLKQWTNQLKSFISTKWPPNGCIDNVSLNAKNIYDAYVHILNSSCTLACFIRWMESKNNMILLITVPHANSWIKCGNCNRKLKRKPNKFSVFRHIECFKCFPLFDHKNKIENENRKCHWH